MDLFGGGEDRNGEEVFPNSCSEEDKLYRKVQPEVKRSRGMSDITREAVKDFLSP